MKRSMTLFLALLLLVFSFPINIFAERNLENTSRNKIDSKTNEIQVRQNEFNNENTNNLQTMQSEPQEGNQAEDKVNNAIAKIRIPVKFKAGSNPDSGYQTLFMRLEPKDNKVVIFSTKDKDILQNTDPNYINDYVKSNPIDLGLTFANLFEELKYSFPLDGLSAEDRDAYFNALEKYKSDNGYKYNLLISDGISLPDDCTGLFDAQTGTILSIEFPKDLSTSNVTSMENMFASQPVLDPDVSNWDTSNVTNMAQMFSVTSKANPDVSKWDTSKVINMDAMFSYAEAAKPDVSKWNTAKVDSMSSMFADTPLANPDVSKWDTSKVENMERMFYNAVSANPDVSNWNTSKVNNMLLMFAGDDVHTVISNPDVSRWDVSNVGLTLGMFENNSKANPDVSKWNTAKLWTSSDMFLNATSAKPDVSNWYTPNLAEMISMFEGAINADPDVSKWNFRKINEQGRNAYLVDSFKNTSVSELDLRTFKLGDAKMDDTATNTPKLQYIYLPANFTKEFSSTNVMSSDFKMQKDGEKASEIMPDSQKSFTFKSTNKDRVYFVPQKANVSVEWLDEDIPEVTRPADLDIELLANGKSIDANGTITIPKASNKINIKEKDNWLGEFSDLDIFSNGNFIRYSTNNDPIDDYLTDVVASENIVRNKNLIVKNSYRTIIEETELGKKPRTPHNFVKVTVDTTDKSSDNTSFKRVFWVTPNREINLPVDFNIQAKSGYIFENWKEIGGNRIWKEGEALKGQFKKDTEIVAQYSIDDSRRLIINPSEPIKDKYAYIFGYPDATIRPEGNLTRAEAAALVIRLADIKAYDNSSKFSDTEKAAWYNKYVNAAYEKDMLLAEDNKIRPNEKITRAEFAKLISKVDKQISKKLPFADTKGHKFEKEIEQAYANGRIEGYPDGSFRPDGEITRAEAAIILNSLFDRSADKDFINKNQDSLKKFKDLDKNHWAYYQLVDAANSHQSKKVESGEMWIKIIK